LISLTTPIAVKSVLGGSATVNYDKVVIDHISYSPTQQTIGAAITLSASADPGQTPLLGNLLIVAQGQGYIDVQIPDLPFHRRIALTAGQQTTVQGWISAAQNQVELGTISVGVMAGTQSAGI
jgi:hypothetical protein